MLHTTTNIIFLKCIVIILLLCLKTYRGFQLFLMLIQTLNDEKASHTCFQSGIPITFFIWTRLLCQANLLIASAAKSSCWISAHIRLSLFSQECLSHFLFIKPCPWLLQNIIQIMRSQRRNYRQTSKILVSHASVISAFLDIWLFFILWLCT